MKRINFILMAVMMILISSCAPTSDIDDLQAQIDALKSGKIASVEQQISSIQASIASLQSLESKLKEIVSAEEAMGKDLSNVKSTVEGLQTSIDNLKKYIDEEIGKLKSWETATFVTLEKYQEVLDELAEIKKTIMTPDIDAAISKAESSMKSWVSEQLTGYYTIAEMDAILNVLSDADASMVSSLQTAKSELTEAYKKAISEAISKFDGEITARIATDIKEATNALESRIDDLESRIAALEDMTQSITLIPQYSDGSIKATDGILDFMCIVTPENGLSYLVDGVRSISLFTAEVQTKSPGTNIHPFYVVSTWLDGYAEVNLKFDISGYLPREEGNSLSVAVGVFSEITTIVSSFVPVSLEFTSEYDDILSEKIGSYIWGTSNERFEFDFLLGQMIIETTPGKRAACNFYWFEDTPTLYNDEPGHYMMTYSGPYSDPYGNVYSYLISLKLLNDTKLSIKYWAEDESGLVVEEEIIASRYREKRYYMPELVNTTFVSINSPEIDKVYYGEYGITNYSPVDGTGRGKPFDGMAGGYEYVCVGYGTQQDYEGIDVEDKCVIVDRGEITFADKCKNAFGAGAAFVLCVNYDDSTVVVDLGEYMTYPFCMIPKSLGDTLKGAEDKVLTLTIDEGLWF